MTRDDPPPHRQHQRADARRNIEAIIDAAARVLARDPDASIADIASAAGLGRVTVYGHFRSRRDLVETVVRRQLAAANHALEAINLTGDPAGALARLVAATWTVTARTGSLVAAAEKVLPATTVRELHHGPLEQRVRAVVERARAAGRFTTDVSTDWMVAMIHATIHAAASEVDAGRLDAGRAPDVITTTLLAAFAAGR